MSFLSLVLIAVAVVVVWAIFTYNRFIRLNGNADEAWSDIDVQLKRRYDLIPNLVETVKGYATHEREAFEQVTKARANAMGVSAHAGVQEHAQAENMLSSTLKSLFAIAEAYPDLKANQNFLELQRELSDTENKIQASRRFYNASVRDLNIAADSFPGNVIARLFTFVKREFFEVLEEQKEPVKVQF